MCTKVKASTRDKVSGMKSTDNKSMAQGILKQVTQVRPELAHAHGSSLSHLLLAEQLSELSW